MSLVTITVNDQEAYELWVLTKQAQKRAQSEIDDERRDEIEHEIAKKWALRYENLAETIKQAM